MPTREDGLTLHEAMRIVLLECPDHTAEQVYLAEVINQRQLYHLQSGAPISSGQIGARAGARHYRYLFEKIPKNDMTGERARIRLR